MTVCIDNQYRLATWDHDLDSRHNSADIMWPSVDSCAALTTTLTFDTSNWKLAQ